MIYKPFYDVAEDQCIYVWFIDAVEKASGTVVDSYSSIKESEGWGQEMSDMGAV